MRMTASAGHPRGPPRPPLSLPTAQCPLVPPSRTLTTHPPHQAPFRALIAQPLSPGVHPRGARLTRLVSVKQMTPSEQAQGGPAGRGSGSQAAQKEGPSLLGWGLGSSAPFPRISE